ncbi:cytochrome P450 4C1-like isoform X2 [Phymastichus coffea]|uniref:cytochrome P450 4C1-like isoform X2 n=1 Tax=Phymastichus coffea TaxID=108790 RepID=UPI00273B16E1|nr:cytochrome P450 4C1-like isoform X2 [Phymastichus coffea]
MQWLASFESSFHLYDSIFLIVTIIGLAGFWWSLNIADFCKNTAKTIKLAATLPGPPVFPLIGNALKLACYPEKILDRFLELARNYQTPMRFWLGPQILIVLSEPRDYEVILGCREGSYKHEIYHVAKPLFGQGLLTGSGPRHRNHRKVILPMLNNKALTEYFAYFNKHSLFCSKLLDKKVNTGPFNIHEFMTNCSYDIVFETILGLSANAQKEKPREIIHWIKTMHELMYTRAFKVWLHPDWLYYRVSAGKKQRQSEIFIRNFIEDAVARTKERYYAEKKKGISESTKFVFLEQLVDYVITNNFMTNSEMCEELFTVFLAVEDTTSLCTSFAFLMLAMHPDIQIKVREEIQSVIGDKSMKIEHLANLKYLEMVIKECLRLFPIGPILLRRLAGDVELETCTLPKGCAVLLAPFVTHRSKKFWTDPEKFIPERFSTENSVARHPFAYLPFSSGIRGCIGQKYAMMVSKTIIVNIIRSFHLFTAVTLETLSLKMDVSVRSKDGYFVSLTRVS